MSSECPIPLPSWKTWEKQTSPAFRMWSCI